jgi:hypothetical protein
MVVNVVKQRRIFVIVEMESLPLELSAGQSTALGLTLPPKINVSYC